MCSKMQVPPNVGLSKYRVPKYGDASDGNRPRARRMKPMGLDQEPPDKSYMLPAWVANESGDSEQPD